MKLNRIGLKKVYQHYPSEFYYKTIAIIAFDSDFYIEKRILKYLNGQTL